MQQISELSRNYKFICISVLSMLSSLSFNIAVSMRETIILSITHGASFVPFVKTYITLPCTFLAGTCYLWLNKRYGTILTYTSINVFFLLYFVIFALIIVPNYAALTPSVETIDHLRASYPHFKHFFGLMAHWPSALFHVFAEIWSIYIFIILFWQVANESLKPGESSCFYPYVTFLISFGTTMAYYPIQILSQSRNPSIMLIGLLVPLGLFMNLIVVTICKTWGLKFSTLSSSQKNAPEQSTLEKLRSLFYDGLSNEVLSLVVCVFSFNFLISLFESCFWTRVSNEYTSQQSLLDFYSFYTLLKGIFSMLFATVNIYLLRKLSWYRVINITPIVSIFAIHLFLLYHLPTWGLPVSFSSISSLASTINLTYFFAIALLLSYASKFSFFDPAKEILISTLPTDEQRISKVFADGLGGRTGKISGGIVQSLLLGFFAADSVLEVIPVILFLATVSSIVFIRAISSLKPSQRSTDDEIVVAA
tara:strand:- start:2783 stop:4219 length:1437 start_codon:yes stop_codon:yes gene_type:complete